MADIYMEFDDGISVGVDKTIDHIAKTGTEGLVDTYTIYYTDETTDTFTVTNGASGAQGEPGEDGITPEIAVSEITGGHRITITTGTDVQTVDVMNGAQGERGPQGPQGESAPIDKTLTLPDYAADAEAVGEKIAEVEDNAEYAVEGILNGNYRTRYNDFTWEDGGINSTTGADNNNGYSIRTGYIEFDEAKIAVIDPNQAYRVYLHAYNKETGAWIGQENKTDISSEYQFTLNPAYKYRLQLYNTDQDVRATADNFIVYDAAVQVPAQIEDLKDTVDYTAETLAEGHYRKRYLGSQLTWEEGGIGSTGQKTSNSYAIRTADFIEFKSSIIAGDGPDSTDYYIGFVAYNKTTDAYVEQSHIRVQGSEKQITINPNYKYKVYVTDATSTARPSGNTVTIYECRDDVIEKRKEEVSNNLMHRGGFRQRRPLVTIIDDDGYLEFWNRCFDSNGNYLLHAPICSAYEGVNLGNGNFMSVDQLKHLEEVGCEILGHGGVALAPKILDPEADPITPEEVEADVIANLRPLLNAGFNPVGYCYPYGACNVKAREIIGKYYSYAMTGIRHLPSSSPDYDKLYNFGLIPHYAINRYPLFDSDNHLKSWNDISQVVEDTVDDNGWLVLYLHFWKDPTETCTATTLNAIIDAIIAAGAEIVTASEAFEIFRNAWQAGDYLGGWNEVNSWGIEYEDHTLADAGSAVSQTGQTDLLLNLSPAESEAY